MNTDSLGGVGTRGLAGEAGRPADGSTRSTLMVCDVCDLVGGPFEPAEAAHLRAVHDRLHHGVLVAA